MTALALDRAESHLFAGGANGNVYKVNLQPAPPASLPSAIDVLHWAENVMTAHESEITAVALTPDSARLVSAARDGTLRVWDTDSCQCLSSLETKGNVLTLVTVPSVFLSVTASHVSMATFERTLQASAPDSVAPLMALQGAALRFADPLQQLAADWAASRRNLPTDSAAQAAPAPAPAGDSGPDATDPAELARQWAEAAQIMYSQGSREALAPSGSGDADH